MKYILIFIAIVIVGGGIFVLTKKPAQAPVVVNPQPVQYKDLVYVETPLTGSKVSNPLTVSGRARGYWYFEASFPVELLDGNGNQILITPAQAQGDWMTEDYVPFSVVLNFPTPATATGTLILHKDNPSGLPENEDSVSIPVTF
ncbi:MAG: Gmad2 immunoglobulin-like domain-containing protein [Minisyncoccota bacterium]